MEGTKTLEGSIYVWQVFGEDSLVPRALHLEKWEEPEAPVPFSDGKAVGTRLYGGRESCEYKGTPETRKAFPSFFSERSGRLSRSRAHPLFFFPSHLPQQAMSELG